MQDEHEAIHKGTGMDVTSDALSDAPANAPDATSNASSGVPFSALMQHLQDTTGVQIHGGSRATDRRSVDRQLKEEVGRLHALMESTNDFIYMLDPFSHEIMYFNTAYRDFVRDAFEVDLVRGIRIEDFVRKERLDWWRELYAQTVVEGRKEVVLEINEPRRIFLLTLSCLCIDSRPYCISVFSKDMTERVRMQEKLEQAVSAAESASLAKSRFLTNMSHEMKTPLNGMMGMMQLVLLEDMPDFHRECLRNALDSAQQLSSVMNDILDYTKMETGLLELSPSTISVRELMADVMRYFTPSARMRCLTLELDMDPALPDAMTVDALRIRQVLDNLLSNAIKFTERGSVRIQACMGTSPYPPPASGIRMIPCLADLDEAGVPDEGTPCGDVDLSEPSPSHWIFRVADTGVGIPWEDLPHVFDAFMQADLTLTKRFPGTGLGLAIVRQIVRRMNGWLEVRSEVGKGTILSVHLPA